MNLNDYSDLPTLEELMAERRRREDLVRHRGRVGSIEASRERCKTLAGFIKEAWHAIEPANPYVHGWVIDAIADHLTAVTNGQITRLLMNVPPGFSKSLTTSVLWPAWEWGPAGLAHLRYFTTSYSDRYVVRDTRRMRDLIMSEWFQDRWPHVQLIRSGESSFENDLRGWREGVPFRSLTGGRGDRVICLPFDQRVLTDRGWLQIGNIVEGRQDVEIAGSGGWQRIEKFERNPPGKIFEISFSDGQRLRCTGDHLILLDGRWTRADKAQNGQTARSPGDLYLRELRQGIPTWAVGEADELQPGLLRRRADPAQGRDQCAALCDLRQAGLSGALAPQAFRVGRIVLLDQMLRRIKSWFGQSRFCRREDRKTLRTLWQEVLGHPEAGGTAGLLFAHLRLAVGLGSTRCAVEAENLSGLSSKFQASEPFNRPLLEAMRRQSPCPPHEGRRQRPLHARRIGEALSAGLVAALQEAHSGAGWRAMSGMWRAAPAGPAQSSRPSHRLCEGKPRRDEPDHGLQVVPRQDAWVTAAAEDMATTTVVSVRRAGFEDQPTYNLRVGPFHDYFAEGVLVHNCDDPHSTESAESDADRETAERIFRESLPTRLIEPAKSAIVVMMQRLHTNDISGLILKGDMGYESLILPMEFEPDRKCYTSIGFQDPREQEGDLLFPERFPRNVVDRDKRVMGSYAIASQFQQRPTVREGGLFKRSWFNTVGAAPAGTRWVRYWDIAATEEQLGSTAAYTAGVKLGRTPAGRFIIGDVARLRAEGHGVRRLIKDTARDDGPEVEIGLPQDPGAAGKIVAQDMVLMLAGYIARALPESGDKIQRAEPIAAQAEAGNVDIITGDWNEDFLDEATNFPGGQFKDQIDALSGAFSRLIGGAMFATPETDISMPAVRLQGIWGRVCAVEITNTHFAAVWAAIDRTSNTWYITDTYRMPRIGMPIHAKALRDRGGPWIPILFDLESRKRSKDQGVRIAEEVNELGLELFTVPLDLEAGVTALTNLMTSSRLRVFETLPDFFAEYRRFRRDEKGELVDSDNELIRCTALIALHGEGLAITENRAASDARGYDPTEDVRERSSTGY